MAKLLEGKVVAAAVIEDLKKRIEVLKKNGVVPGLATILVGDDPASAGYVRKKHQACEEIGIRSFHRDIAASAKQSVLLDTVKELNENPDVHGYIIQYPVPANFDFAEAMSLMKPEKDADGLHPSNLGKLVMQEKGPIPATPAGIKEMFIHYGIPTDGKEVVIVGRGTTLGRPLALLLSEKAKGANAAVTVVHSAVKDISKFTKRADILIAAVGRPSIIMPDMVKEGAVVVSGGISWKGKKLLADVDESVAEVASWITPRLGGVGPTTIAMLMRNTVEAAELAAAKANAS